MENDERAQALMDALRQGRIEPCDVTGLQGPDLVSYARRPQEVVEAATQALRGAEGPHDARQLQPCSGCGHTRDSHTHHRGGTDCCECACRGFVGLSLRRRILRWIQG